MCSIAVTDQLWQEAFVSATLRALAVGRNGLVLTLPKSSCFVPFQQPSYPYSLWYQLAVRMLDPLPSASQEERFLNSVADLWSQGDLKRFDDYDLS
jgi:hypothetical protein